MSSLSVVFPLSSMSLIYSQMWKYFHLVVLLWCDSAECSRGFTYWELGRVCFQWYRIDVLISYRTLLCPKALVNDTLVYLSLSWWTAISPPYPWGNPSFLKIVLGPVLLWAGPSALSYIHELTTPYPQPQLRCQGFCPDPTPCHLGSCSLL